MTPKLSAVLGQPGLFSPSLPGALMVFVIFQGGDFIIALFKQIFVIYYNSAPAWESFSFFCGPICACTWRIADLAGI
jgi:hypothetical protein